METCELYDCVLDPRNLSANKETFRNLDLHTSKWSHMIEALAMWQVAGEDLMT